MSEDMKVDEPKDKKEKKAARPAAVKAWVFTLNNYDEEDIQRLEEGDWWSYLIYGKEVGEGGTPHLQGYVQLKTRLRLNGVKVLIRAAHWEARRGSHNEAREYCMKDGTYKELGEANYQGKRDDLDQCRMQALEEGLRGVTSTCSQQQMRVAEKFLTYNEEERDWMPEITWIWGPPRIGKSKLARTITGKDDVYTKNTMGKWWCGYDKHANVIIDDFRDSWMPLTELLSILDRYPRQVECKNGNRQLLARKIVITSLYHPEQMYLGTGEPAKQLLGRIKEIIKVGALGVEDAQPARARAAAAEGVWDPFA